MKSFLIKSVNEYHQVFDFVFLNSSNKIILFSGNLGSGKTTLIQYFCNKFNVSDRVLSPTFNLMNEYSAIHQKIKIFHFDLYRINSVEELINIDFIDYIDSGNYCFIEWPDICKPLLKNNFTEIQIRINSKGFRELNII